MQPQVDKILATADCWEFDAFALDAASQGHPISILSYYLFHETQLMHKFRLRKVALAR